MLFDELFESNKKYLKEFAPGGSGGRGGGDEGPGDDPYKYPKPEHYRRAIDFFGQFEADHFDREDMNDAKGEFRGYWDYNGKPRLIAYFKFDNPGKTDSDDPGMGWYYEPNEDQDQQEQERVKKASDQYLRNKYGNPDVSEGRYFKTAYGYAGGSKPGGGTYKHPEQIKADNEAKKKAKEKEKNKQQGVSEDLPAHVKKSDIPPAMRSRLTMKDVEAERPRGAYRYRVIPATQGESPKDFLDQAAAQAFAKQVGGRVQSLGEVKKKLGERGATRSARIERILKMLRARNPQAQDDLEALLLNYRADQAHDQQEIDRLDAENDQEDAAIADLQQTVQRIHESRWAAAERAALDKFKNKNHPAFQMFAESWYRAHGGA